MLKIILLKTCILCVCVFELQIYILIFNKKTIYKMSLQAGVSET